MSLVLLLDVGNEDNVIFRSLEEYFPKKIKTSRKRARKREVLLYSRSIYPSKLSKIETEKDPPLSGPL